MRRRTQRHWLTLAQMSTLLGLGAISLWNLAGPQPLWWIGTAFSVPGLLLWAVSETLPRLVPRFVPRRSRYFRLTYDTAAGWDDTRLRQALLNLTRLSGLDLIWAGDGRESGCWLGVDDETVLRRIVTDLVPGGRLEEEAAPLVEAGVVILRVKSGLSIPPPIALCERAGIDGVYFRWLSETSATLALWGPQAEAVAGELAAPADILVRRQGLWYPPFVGDNPYPALPDFPAAVDRPGLSSVSHFNQMAPALRLKQPNGLTLGPDSDGYPVGFDLPEVAAMAQLRIYGRQAEAVVIQLAEQAIRRGLPVAVLDGDGGLTGRLTQRLVRELAMGQVLLGDSDRPAQSRNRLNPLWLPSDRPELWPVILTRSWPLWLRELGVTLGGLGLPAYRHTLVAVMLTAILAAQRGLRLDPEALAEALETPDFLAQAGETGGPALLGETLWQWWQTEGRATTPFDVHLRLGHLRERLTVLLDLPEYSRLWRAPYRDLETDMLKDRRTLLWRLPDPRRRLRPYVTSQLLALSTLLTRADSKPIVLFLHELAAIEPWVSHLNQFSAARLVVSTTKIGSRPVGGPLVLSRLERADAERLSLELPMLRATDLRRLPEGRLVVRCESHLGTVDLQT